MENPCKKDVQSATLRWKTRGFTETIALGATVFSREAEKVVYVCNSPFKNKRAQSPLKTQRPRNRPKTGSSEAALENAQFPAGSFFAFAGIADVSVSPCHSRTQLPDPSGVPIRLSF